MVDPEVEKSGSEQETNTGSGSWEELLEDLSPAEKVGWGIVLAFYTAALLISIGYLISSVVTTNLVQAQAWAGVVSGLATVGLVVVTSLYVVYTKRLVAATQDSVLKEQEYREAERDRNLRSLRQGLIHEIDSLPKNFVQNLNYDRTQNLREVAPNTIFQQNAARIGLLEDKEALAVIEYYHTLSTFEEYIIAYSKREGGGNIRDRGRTLVKKSIDAKMKIEEQLEVEAEPTA